MQKAHISTTHLRRVQIKEVLRLTPRKRQTLLFSATMTDEVKDLAALSLQRPVRLAADAAGAAPKTLQQEIIKLKVTTQGCLLCPDPAHSDRLTAYRESKCSASWQCASMHRAYGLQGAFMICLALSDQAYGVICQSHDCCTSS